MSNETPLSPEAEKLAAARKRNLDLALSQIQKDFGENAIMRLGDNVKMEVDVIPTGNLLIDRALGVGGFARGRIVEIYGPESSGKTTLTLTAIAQAQKAGGLAAFIDVEHALDPQYAARLGVNLDDLLVSQPSSGEVNPLLGQPPAHEFVEKIDEIVMSHSEVCGMHDLIVHDYGPGRQMISLHAEVPAEGNILELHDVIDNIENELRETLGCEATIHMDPVVTSDEHVSETKAAMVSLIKAIDEDLSIHDFRMVSGGTHTNLIFDILAPFGFRLTDEELLTEVLQSVHEHFGDNYYVVTKIDHSYI